MKTERGFAFWMVQGPGWFLLIYVIVARWGPIALAAALGITVYWTIACLAAIVAVRGAPGWLVPSETPYWVVLVPIGAWGAWGLWHVLGESRQPG